MVGKLPGFTAQANALMCATFAEVTAMPTEEGGFKQSGLGRLNGLSALDDFVEYRTFIHDVTV